MTATTTTIYRLDGDEIRLRSPHSGVWTAYDPRPNGCCSVEWVDAFEVELPAGWTVAADSCGMPAVFAPDGGQVELFDGPDGFVQAVGDGFTNIKLGESEQVH